MNLPNLFFFVEMGSYQTSYIVRPEAKYQTVLAILGVEWIVIIAVLVAFLLWGPKKLPELARSVGLAKNEFQRASKEESSTADESARDRDDS